MTKNITITNTDSINLEDKSNMGGTRQKMIHEQLFDQYGIDPKKVFEKTGLLKTIPPEWISDIISFNVKSCRVPRSHENINLKEKVFNLGFDKEETCENFYKEFNAHMPNSINAFITSKKEDPKKYNRIIIVETTIETQQIIIRY